MSLESNKKSKQKATSSITTVDGDQNQAPQLEERACLLYETNKIFTAENFQRELTGVFMLFYKYICGCTMKCSVTCAL